MGRRSDYEDYQDRYKKYEKVIKDADQFKTQDEVFDQQNLRFIYDLFKKRLISTVDHPISTGKEANVFLCSTRDEDRKLALKIFRTSTATFKSYLPYLDGDPRFENIRHDRRSIIYAWALKEYKNLIRMDQAGVRVPEGLFNHRNLLLMELILLDDQPAPPLKKAILDIEDHKVIMDEVIGFLKLMVGEANLVHSDLSEYNILISNDGPVVIDVGQGVVLDHPHAKKYLERDIGNLAHYYNGMGLDFDWGALLEELMELGWGED